jgi:hypothetical protein
VNSRRLRTVFESVHGGQTAVAAQRVCRITMRITATHDRSIIPLEDFIQQAHQIGVGHQRANFRFVDCSIIRHSTSPARFTSGNRRNTRKIQGFGLVYPRIFLSVGVLVAVLPYSVPEGIKIEPVVRRETRIMLQPRDVALHPQLDFLGPMLSIQHDLVGEMFEVNIVAISAAVHTEE